MEKEFLSEDDNVGLQGREEKTGVPSEKPVLADKNLKSER